jgi:hypothetical protein
VTEDSGLGKNFLFLAFQVEFIADWAIRQEEEAELDEPSPFIFQ